MNGDMFRVSNEIFLREDLIRIRFQGDYIVTTEEEAVLCWLHEIIEEDDIMTLVRKCAREEGLTSIEFLLHGVTVKNLCENGIT